ncbi:MAG: hypothetical protein GY841_10650 [FCB group bacterium]|nr:hypothetical protein [FCB group bacterium]
MKRLREWVVANKEIIATRIKEWAVGLVTNFKRIVKWVKGVAIGIGIFFALAGALKAVIAVLTVVNALAAANPISLIVLAVVAAIAAIAALVYWAEELVAWFESIPAPIRIILMVLNPFIAMLYGFVKIVAYIKENWIDMWNGMVDTAEWAINALLQNGPISWLIAAQFTLMDLVVRVRDTMVSAWGGIVKFFNGVWSGVMAEFDKVKAFFGDFVTDTEDTWKPLTDFFGDLWGGIVETFETAVGSLMEILSPVTDLFRELTNAKDKVIARKIGEIKLGARIQRDTVPQKEVKKTNSILDDILAESEKLRNSAVESTNHQTSALQKTMNSNAAKTARVVNQRFIDVSAPFRHFLRGEDEQAAGGGFAPVTTSPQTTTQRFLEERSMMSQTEVTLRAGRGTTAEVTGGELGPGLRLEPTGGF